MSDEKKQAKSGKVDQIRALREKQADDREAKAKKSRAEQRPKGSGK